MTIFSNSRYRFGDTIRITDSDGVSNTVHKLRKTTTDPVVGSSVHGVAGDETFEKIAFERYGDADKWYVITDANPKIFWPLDLEAGDEIVIPPRSTAALL